MVVISNSLRDYSWRCECKSKSGTSLRMDEEPIEIWSASRTDVAECPSYTLQQKPSGIGEAGIAMKALTGVETATRTPFQVVF